MTEIQATITHDGVDYSAELGRIVQVSLGPETRGILSSYIMIDFIGSGQGFGGYDLRHGDACARWVNGVLHAMNVDDWAELRGKPVWVLRRNGPRGLIEGIKGLDGPVFLRKEMESEQP